MSIATSKWEFLRNNFSKLTGAMLIEEDLNESDKLSDSKIQSNTKPVVIDIKARRASAMPGLGMLDPTLAKSMAVGRDVKQIAMDIFESKLLMMHRKRQAKLRNDICKTLDLFERKLVEEGRLKAERQRFNAYNNLLLAELKRNVSAPSLLNLQNDKEMNRVKQDISEMDEKFQKLLQLKEQNEKSLDQIKDFYKYVAKVLKENFANFQENPTPVQQTSSRKSRNSALPSLAEDNLFLTIQKPRTSFSDFERFGKSHLESDKFDLQRSVVQRSSLSPFSKIKHSSVATEWNVPPALFTPILETSERSIDLISAKKPDPKSQLFSQNNNKDQSKEEYSTSSKRQSQHNPKHLKHLNAPPAPPQKKSVIVNSLPQKSNVSKPSGTGQKTNVNANSRLDSNGRSSFFKKKSEPQKALENKAETDEARSITSSIGSSIYNEILEDIEPVDQRASMRVISDKDIIAPILPKVKPKFIPVKISFKVGPDALPPSIQTDHKGERIYRDLAFKNITFHLDDKQKIIGFQFTFFSKSTKAEQLGVMHGTKGSNLQRVDFTNGEFFNMTHFQNDNEGIKWIKFFTNLSQFELGIENKNQKPSGVRYFPKEVNLCKFFSYFNKQSGLLAQMKFIYIRTVFY